MADSKLSDEETLADALAYLRSAIALLDRLDAPPHIAAHADLAASLLSAVVEPADGLESKLKRSAARLS